jgi:hypothetical protein
MCRVAGRGGLPATYPAQGTVTQTDRLRAARTGQRAKDRGQTPPEPTGTVQHDNQNVPRERSRPAELQCLTFLAMSECPFGCRLSGILTAASNDLLWTGAA